jgi:hypothetical protein
MKQEFVFEFDNQQSLSQALIKKIKDLRRIKQVLAMENERANKLSEEIKEELIRLGITGTIQVEGEPLSLIESETIEIDEDVLIEIAEKKKLDIYKKVIDEEKLEELVRDGAFTKEELNKIFKKKKIYRLYPFGMRKR